MSHWRSSHPAPDVDGWRRVRAFEPRLRRAIEELYSWYAENAADLYPLYRDAVFTPASTHRARRENIERMTEAILGRAGQSKRSDALRAAIGHVLGFWTWRSLVVEEGCTPAEAVELAVRFVRSAAARRGP